MVCGVYSIYCGDIFCDALCNRDIVDGYNIDCTWCAYPSSFILFGARTYVENELLSHLTSGF